tara:strand:- start:7619 stop:8119 length:501 start_codon:yes stop_codon:yes gene_type:complete
MKYDLLVRIDSQNQKWLSEWSWCGNRKEPNYHYACRSINGGKKHIYMHRAVLEKKLGRALKEGEGCNHINGDTLDNREENLRLATRGQQRQNSAKRKNSLSKYKGITKRGPSYAGGPQRTKPWNARICVDYREISLGYYSTEIEAARAYNEAASSVFGEFARLNQI